MGDNTDEAKAIYEYVTAPDRDDYLTYTHTERSFSFDLPADFLVSSFEEDGHEIITAEHPQLDMNFQIVISPFDEDIPITKERILDDLPSLVVEDVVEYVFAGDIPAICFSSYDASLGDTREIWFVRDSSMYQIRMHAGHKEWLDAWVRVFASDLTFEAI